jgi:hypothetical protein
VRSFTTNDCLYFIGGPEKRELDYFIEKTKVDELMVATAIYQHEARLHPTRFWDN